MTTELKAAAEAAERDRKAREHAQARRDAQTPAERAADDAERERLRQLVGTTVEWFSEPVAGRTFPYTPPTEETP